MVSIGEAIKTIRKQCGLRQIDIANAMTVTQSYISQVENGREIPILWMKESYSTKRWRQ